MVNLLGLSIVVQAHQFRKKEQEGELTESDKQNLNKIINESHNINIDYAQNEDITSEEANIIKDSSGYLTYQRWKSNPKSISSAKKKAKNNNVAYVDYSQAINKKYPDGSSEYLYVTTDINQELANLLHNGKINSLRYLEESTSNAVQISVFRENIVKA